MATFLAAARTEHSLSFDRRSRRKLRVLLADDHVDTRDGYRIYLETIGMDVCTSADGATAVRMAVEAIPDVIVLDVRMPKLSGLAAMRQLRGNMATSAIPIVLLTGASDDVLPSDRADAVVSKPCTPSDLVAV